MAYDENTPFELVAVVSAICGADVGLSLAKQLAGRQVCPPKTWQPDNPVCKIIGRDRYSAVADAIGGVCFTVNNNASLTRKEAVARMSRDGAKIHEIVSAVGLTERTVYQIRKRLRDEGVLPVRARKIAKAIAAGKDHTR